VIYRKQITFLLIGLVLIAWTGLRQALAAEADMVIYNGKILTVDSPDPNNFSTAEAAAIRDGKFLAVGRNSDILKLAGADTKKIDLGGRTVLPGLVETHDHVMEYSRHWFPKGTLQYGRTVPPITWTNKPDFLAQLRTMALKMKSGDWIITEPEGGIAGSMGIVPDLQEGKVTCADLDKVTPNNPLHMVWSVDEDGLVNSKVLDLLLARYPQIRGVLKDASGKPSCRIKGLANMTIQYEFWPHVAPESLGPYYKMELDEVAAQGLTTLSTRLKPDELAAYSWLHSRGELPIRFAYTLDSVSHNPNVEAMVTRLVGLQGGSGNHIWGAGDDQLWMIGLAPTFNIDNVPGIAGSCVNAVYPREALNFPLWKYQFYGPHGLCRLDDPNYNDPEAIEAVAKNGFRNSAMHTGGDRGIDQFLDILEKLAKQYPEIRERRWAMDHCRFLNDQEAARAKKLNLMLSCGPKYVYAGEKGDIGAYKILYGEKVAEDVVVPLRRIIDHGLIPVMQIDQHAFHPFLTLQVAVTREDMTGKVWGAQQRINRKEALYMYTRWSSQYVIKENLIGSIEAGKAADFIVLNRDYLTVPEQEIGQIDPLLSVIGGKFVYTDPSFANTADLPQVGYRGNRSRWWRGTRGDNQKLSDM